MYKLQRTIIDLFWAKSVSWSVAIFNLASELKRKGFLSELVQYTVLILIRAGRRNRCLFSAYVDRQHAIMIMVCLNSLNTENSSGIILETNCTYFKICRCWKHTKWFDNWSRCKRVRSILKRKNEHPRKISSYHFPVIFKTTQPVSGYWVTEKGRLNTWGPNMRGNFMCWRQYNHVYLTKGFSYCKYIHVYWKLNY